MAKKGKIEWGNFGQGINAYRAWNTANNIYLYAYSGMTYGDIWRHWKHRNVDLTNKQLKTLINKVISKDKSNYVVVKSKNFDDNHIYWKPYAPENKPSKKKSGGLKDGKANKKTYIYCPVDSYGQRTGEVRKIKLSLIEAKKWRERGIYFYKSEHSALQAALSDKSSKKKSGGLKDGIQKYRLTITYYKKSGSTWKQTETTTETVDYGFMKRYTEAAPFFRRLGGSERVSWANGNVTVTSINPGKDIKKIAFFKMI